jgi:hypothetical protein
MPGGWNGNCGLPGRLFNNVKTGAFSPIILAVLSKPENRRDASQRGRHGQEKETAIQDAGKDLLASLQLAEPESGEIHKGRWENTQKRISPD